jgi:hypothetical protein
MKRRLVSLTGGPCRDTAVLIATTKQRLRRGDVRALAVVIVDGKGSVSTAFAGHRSGHFFTLAAGLAGLNHRFHSEG